MLELLEPLVPLELMRISILGDLVTSVGVILLAVLLYCVLNETNRIIALVGLGAWLVEAIALAVSKANNDLIETANNPSSFPKA